MRLLNPNSRLLVRDREILFVAEKFLSRCDDHRLDESLGEWKRYQASTDLPNFMDQDAIDVIGYGKTAHFAHYFKIELLVFKGSVDLKQ